MNLYLIRHFKVDFKWNRLYNSKEFDSACAQYDIANVLPQTIDITDDTLEVYISTLMRTEETATLIGIHEVKTKTSLIMA